MSIHDKRVSCAISVRGVVQGVGFRPFVFKLATELALDGTVCNHADGVRIELAGTKGGLDEFLRRLPLEAPQAARITGLSVETPAFFPASGFHILASQHGEKVRTVIPPDLATCPECLAEIFDPANRRYRYPFTNCTNCGPRYTMTAHIPYDRPNTSMRTFQMCPACQKEYDNPLDRRFHAQPNACPVCGPSLSWHDASGKALPGDALKAAARALKNGAIVAIKGLGGFHLAADGQNNEALLRLRARKHRPDKPFALMAAGLEAARRVCRVSPLEARLLESAAHPIVLLDALPDPPFIPPLAPALAPGLGILGLMLAYTPLHHLLLAEKMAPAYLVMTSANLSGSPICAKNSEALAQLAGIADFFLMHNREILTRMDDSVLRVMAGQARFIRRGRGYVPEAIALAGAPDTLACGGTMKNTFCLARAGEAFLSQHIGELDHTECVDFYLESLKHLEEVLECAPTRIVCDRHPDYQSTRLGENLARSRGTKPVFVGHHHAHALSVMAEHGLSGPVLALVFDGAGYGEDGNIWGGEILLVTRGHYERLAHLAPLPLIGGDTAVREPWRLALALYEEACAKGPKLSLPQALLQIDAGRRAQILALWQKKINCPLSTGAGRLFDAVSALLGLCLFASYEGQAAMLLEHQAALAQDKADAILLPVCVRNEGRMSCIETKPMTRALLLALGEGQPVPGLALAFHRWLCASCFQALLPLVREHGINELVLAGGCMQNKVFFEALVQAFEPEGLHVYSAVRAPANDGGLALGQAFFKGDN